MVRERLVQQAVDGLIDRVVDGEFGVGDPLPAQPVLAEQLRVSRLTAREAIEVLRSRGIVRVVHGSGTYLSPVEEWADARAIGRYVERKGGAVAVPLQVLEVRRLIEMGAAELCAARRTDDDLRVLLEADAAMKRAHEEDDAEAFVAADRAFHECLITGARNPFLRVTYAPLVQTLEVPRVAASAMPEVRQRILDSHQDLIAAVQAGDARAAFAAMESHMVQSEGDYRYTAPRG